MPRIYDSTSSPHDFCLGCFPSEVEGLDEYGDVGDGPDNRGNCYGYDAEHPSYEYEDYVCCVCRTPLIEQDN